MIVAWRECEYFWLVIDAARTPVSRRQSSKYLSESVSILQEVEEEEEK